MRKLAHPFTLRVLATLALPVLPLLLSACPKDAIVEVKTQPPSSASAVASSTAPTATPFAFPAGPTGLTPDEDAALDRAAQPCDDFFQFACGGWIKATPIPSDEDRWVKSFNVIREKNEKLLREILESFARGEPAKAFGREVTSPDAKMLGDFYASCTDEKAIDALGTKPLTADLAAIDAIKNKTDLAHVLASMHARGVQPLFAVGQQQDFADATKVIGAIDQAGLGMPDREYYLKTDEKAAALRDKYAAHVQAMFALLGDKPDVAKTHADATLRIEKALAEASMTKEDRRDPKKVYHRMDAPELKKEFAAFPWDRYEKDLGVAGVAQWNVAEPQFLQAAAELVSGKAPVEDWKPYLKWHLLHATAPALSKPFVDENFKWQQALRGTPNLAPRWKRCVRMIDGEVGFALAKAFVSLTLGEEGKAQVKDLIGLVETQMGDNLKTIAWMDADTRAKGETKLGKIANKVAYPDVWRSYAGLKIERGRYFDDVLRAEALEEKRQLGKIGKPVDRSDWEMTPPTVNAYYEPSMNEMVFPAGILQVPFFGTEQSVPVNFGGIGMVMGHKLTHGFDDQGRQFDGDGNLKDWWSPSVGAEFDRRAACIEKQYSEYTVNGEHVNGKLTLGENIADNGGVKLAFHAMEKSLAKKPDPTQGGFTPEQRFFIGFGQAWCASTRPEEARRRLAVDPHSPPQFRVNGPLSNSPEFAAAFSCAGGTKMVRKDRCEVW